MSRKLLFTFIIFGFAIAFLFMGIQNISETGGDKHAEVLENAIIHASVHCYAVEGKYPESLDYLKSEYGITYNEDEFIVKYEVTAGNLRPQIKVIPLGQ